MIWLEPAHELYPDGVNLQRIAPVPASTAAVFPYDVVTMKRSCRLPPTGTPRR